jgi:hypothetical protein
MSLSPNNKITTNSTDNWVPWWNNFWLPNLQAEIDDAGGGFGAGVLTGDGRLVTDDGDAGKLQMTGSPSLAVILPAGAQIVTDGVLHVVDGDQTLIVPSGFTGWITPVATVNETTGVVTWSAATSETRNALGTGTAGKVTSSADAVTLLNTSEAESDVILALPVLQARQRSILTRLAALESGGSGGGSGGFAYSGIAPWLPDPGDTRRTDIVIAAMLDELTATLRAEMQNGGIRPRQTVVDQLMHELAITRQMVIRLGTLSPVTTDDAERSQSANVVGRADGSIYGDGSNSHPDHITTNLTINSDGSLEP